MSKGVIIGGAVVLMLCLLLIVGVFMMSSKRTPSMEPQMAVPPVAEPQMAVPPVAEPQMAVPPAVEEKISGYVKLYSGCDYNGEILKAMVINDIPISDADKFKGSITSDHYNTVPSQRQHKLIFKSIETKNANLSGTFDKLDSQSSQKAELNMVGSQKMSFCNPNNKEIGSATKLNLTFKLKK